MKLKNLARGTFDSIHLKMTQMTKIIFFFSSSTWSIDLCYLLKKFGIQHIFTTITMGVNPDFRNHDYYGPILWRDHVRVSEKFASAEKNGLTVQRKTVDIAQILRHLAFKGPIIALTNGQLLHCTLCQSKNALL